jgi:eukaryotic-like serine/threonine-protein kinase
VTDLGALPSRQTVTHAPEDTTAISPVEALDLEEVGRQRIFLRSIVITCAGTAASLPWLRGHPDVKAALFVGLAVCALVCGRLYLLLRAPTNYTEARATIAMVTCAVVANIAILFWGTFSAAQMTIVILLYVFSRGRSARGATIVWATCAVTQGAFAAAIISGALRDPGLVSATDLSTAEKLITHAIGQMVFLFTFLSGRLTRRTSLDAIGRLDSAVREIARREAQLREVRQELDRALGVGGPGRFTTLQLGDYRLGNVLGRGGMGEVYEARHSGTNDEAAVKVMRVEAAANPTMVARFQREARAANALDSRHVVRVLQAAQADEGLPYLVMERLHGPTLGEQLLRQDRLDFEATLALMDQVGSAIDAAAAAGIVHRDLKPQNLLCAAPDDTWKVLDFGVSQLAESSGTLTQGDIVGTPAYMAPEQARGDDVDSRADVYSLAAIAYRALTGVPPHQAGPKGNALFQVVFRGPARPGALAELPSDVDAFFAVALAKQPADRFATAGELLEAARAAFDGRLPSSVHRRAKAALDKFPWAEQHEPVGDTAVTVASPPT